MQDHSVGASEVRDEVLEAAPEQLADDLAALAAIEGELGALDVALRRLDDGSYWTCEACGEGIDDAVLAEAPLRRRCAHCGPPADAPTDGAPTAGASTDGAPTAGAPADGAPRDGALTDVAPTAGAPAEGGPTDGAPTGAGER